MMKGISKDAKMYGVYLKEKDVVTFGRFGKPFATKEAAAAKLKSLFMKGIMCEVVEYSPEVTYKLTESDDEE